MSLNVLDVSKLTGLRFLLIIKTFLLILVWYPMHWLCNKVNYRYLDLHVLTWRLTTLTQIIMAYYYEIFTSSHLKTWLLLSISILICSSLSSPLKIKSLHKFCIHWARMWWRHDPVYVAIVINIRSIVIWFI